MGYHVSDANSYIVVTGGGIPDVHIVKKAFVYPWQKHSRISISPFDFEITLQVRDFSGFTPLLPSFTPLYSPKSSISQMFVPRIIQY